MRARAEKCGIMSNAMSCDRQTSVAASSREGNPIVMSNEHCAQAMYMYEMTISLGWLINGNLIMRKWHELRLRYRPSFIIN